VPQNVWYLVLPLVLPGPAQLGPSGHLRALVNLVQPMLQVNGALGTLLVPTFARQPEASAWRFTGFMTALSALYAPALVLLGPFATRLLYRGAYPSDAPTWWVLGAVPACFAFYTSLRSYCVARGRPNLPLWATAFAALGSLSAGVWLCASWPLFGSALAMLQGCALQGLCLAWLVQRRSMASARPSSERAA
jgi:O-antigen/teichoic acid export membrane protein